MKNNRVIPLEFYERSVEQVAPDLLGTRLYASTPTGLVAGLIVETEAYGGPEDLASHAAFRKTGYVKYMWGTPGSLYVYKAYGTYPCLNIVTGLEGEPSAVLIRAISIEAPEPDDRSGSGPGRLGRSIGLDTSHNGHVLTTSPFWIEPGETEPENITRGTRVGVKRGDPRHWRFAIAGHPAVSRPRL